MEEVGGAKKQKIMNEFVCHEARFKFWNGKKTYTVERCPNIPTWYIFDEDDRSNCLAKFEVAKNEKTACTLEMASYYLDKYFESIKSDFFVSI